jgi:predicted MFS family arabinose efflux permease
MWLGAKNNLMYLRLALGGAALLPISALLASVLGPVPLYVGFLIAGMTLSNLYLSYQNWVVGHASADERPIYAGLFNTIIAGITLLAPIIGGTLVQQIGYEFLFGLSLVMGMGALFVMWRYVPG